jgi:hypothetical protein
MVFDSEALKMSMRMRPVYEDLADLFLREAERCGMDLFFGIYDSGTYWERGNYKKEIEINKFFTEEIITKYGHREAFKGWYASHELQLYNDSQMKLYQELSTHLKQLKDIPILMSPYIHGRKQFSDPISPNKHEKQWDRIMSRLAGKIDIIAFQDGQIDFSELPAFMEINVNLAKKYHLTAWSNVETFERGMPIDFLPIAWPNLRYKLEIAEKAGVEKLITFEFSHFLSPNSIYASAHGLYRQYKRWVQSI